MTGLGGLIRLILRRDRVILPVWILATAGIVLQWSGTAATVYPTVASRRERIDEVAATPMFLLFQGRVFDSSLGAVLVQRAAPAALVLAALGAAVLLVRHTRSEEQAGRRELLGSTVVGRHAPLTAALVVLFGCGLLIAAISAVALVGAGLPVAGSVCFGFVVGSGVWATAALTAVLVQLTQSARAAAIAAVALFYAFHLVRGIGAMAADPLTWTTPNGWLENARPFAGERWWVFGLVVLWAVVLLWIAYALAARRDLAAGVFPERLGPAGAVPSLRSPLGLAWRMHRGMLAAWLAIAAAFGTSLGFVGGEAMEEYATAPWVIDYARAVNADSAADAFFMYVIFIMAFFIGIYAVMTALRLRSEETGGGAETVLSEPVARRRWMASHLVFGAGGPVLILAMLGLGLGIGSGIAHGDLGGELAHMLSLTIPLSPALWVIAGVTAAAFGLLPRAAAVIGWAGLAIGIMAEVAVKANVLPVWVFRTVSPFSHVSPYFHPSAVDYVGLTLLAAGLTAVGVLAFRRRDLTA